eukprot:7390517-Heterocapsa_arctica.AAC.1
MSPPSGRAGNKRRKSAGVCDPCPMPARACAVVGEVRISDSKRGLCTKSFFCCPLLMGRFRSHSK